MTDKQRRQLITFFGAGTVAIPLSALVSTLPAHAEEAPMVDELSMSARNWEYRAVSDKLEKNCSKCALYQGDVHEDAGPCPLFPHMRVSADGWCNAFSPTPS